ncbi:MAG: hypothetical protein WCS77_01305 [Elusimicrobiaceae bacterium]
MPDGLETPAFRTRLADLAKRSVGNVKAGLPLLAVAALVFSVLGWLVAHKAVWSGGLHVIFKFSLMALILAAYSAFGLFYGAAAVLLSAVIRAVRTVESIIADMINSVQARAEKYLAGGCAGSVGTALDEVSENAERRLGFSPADIFSFLFMASVFSLLRKVLFRRMAGRGGLKAIAVFSDKLALFSAVFLGFKIRLAIIRVAVHTFALIVFSVSLFYIM